MRDRFRDLEEPATVRKKDVVLMATVTSFESLDHPSKSELRQFAELFSPLFQASSEEAKRQAVAALSQCATVPPAVSLFIGCQPIAIAAPFLTSSQAIDDDTLITIARTQGAAHAKAIVRRPSLSPKVIDALVSLHQAEPERGMTMSGISPAVTSSASAAETHAADSEAERLAREEALRQKIKQVARHLARDDNNRLGLRSLSDVQEALLVRFAREREAQQFAATLADALSSSRWLAERIMIDTSGQQLAVTLTSLGMGFADAVYALERFYPHLAEQHGSVSRAWLVLDSIDAEESYARVEAWRRADSYTYLPPEQKPSARPGAPLFGTKASPIRELRVVSRSR
ncbi:DUF2336 domain-containing protein [Rhizobium leucaenae]|uniref:Uncharacterized protein (DUF2336 family) n=1 Tax=Rhizobium leucaenae TaxID=29450 RepID=A0A7W6ZTH8_9HYPH|nr:DUF2336 domain-containing protein [Rhizobium leucaenae]MBB4568295.1 uncharacterized protein (DUF2336 family) [Rhizobium leucaenae]MBB6300546.1 uncharacterized protein (DUF2336 family) [Rhizobium leucaenae]